PPARRHQRRTVALVSVGGLVVVLAIVLTLVALLGSADGSLGSGSAIQVAGPTGSAAPAPGGTGAGSGSPTGSAGASGSGTSTQPGPSEAPPGKLVLAGIGCPQDASRSVSTHGRWARATGGWSDNGCDGSYRTHRSTAAAADSVTWKFATPTAAKCAVEIYVPAAASSPEVFYDVVSGSDVNTFTIDQLGNHGKWVPGGTFPTRAGTFSIRLNDRGDGSTIVVADAVRVTCR
ncbi:MAG TPA: hypothetical protein VFX70_16815, partial [Mycobacteriales bacterium]|nr:hypothetical protein [Mycobacteriales bacterium]